MLEISSDKLIFDFIENKNLQASIDIINPTK
jgi:hypothetical protein